MTSSVAHGEIFGQESEIQQLVSTLLSSEVDGDNPVLVASVVGVGGFGKTTLAQHAYNNTRVAEYFDMRMWICVTDAFDESRITREMLESVSSSRFRHDSITNFKRLQVALRTRLVSKRFLLVLDDVRNNDKINLAIGHENWQKLLSPLKAAANGSKILLTTRSSMVAKMLQSAYITNLECLSDKDCWSLIKTTMFDDTNHLINSQLANIGSEITKTLSGLPLVAKVVARQLKFIRISQCTFKNALYIAVSSPRTRNLKLTVDLMWMAQGYAYPDGCRRMEDIGKQYVDELSEECFRIGGDEHRRIPSSVRHLSIHLDSLSMLDETIPYSNLRTLIFFTSRMVAPINISIPQLCVLDLSPCKIDRVLDSIRQCVHLRYLNISSTAINMLPEYLGKLYHLQVLNLSGCRLEKLPSSINNLVSLRHLTAANQILSTITDIGSLRYLQRLPIFKVTSEKTNSIIQLGYLQELRGSLHIRNLENIDAPNEAKEAMLCKKECS
uniref:Uncharacterized protein n=1 Tax=Oryza punctata TaxID=4537 RepID=A0A0E0KFM6_ORYPU